MEQKISHDSEIPAHGQQVITTCAFLHRDFGGIEKVFLPKRAATKKFLPNVHEIPGGHVDFGEDLIVGLKREIQEEFGMNIEVGDPFFAFTYTNDIKGSHSVEVVYFAQFTDPIENITIHPDDHSEYGWYAEDELDKVLNDVKGEEDPEIQAIEKGFALLRGENPKY